jgi:hypothetical protein
MCCMALVAWVLSISQEIDSAWTLLMAIFALPSTGWHGMSIGKDSDGKLHILKHGLFNLVFSVVVHGIRLGIALILLYYGW